jgi:hypothetical protein
MSQPHRNPRGRVPRYSLRHLGVILVAYVVYGVLLFGTSAIVAEPGYAELETHLEPFADLVSGDWQTEFGAWFRDAAQSGSTAR